MAKYVNLDKIIAKLEKAIEEHKADISEENAITAWIFKRFIAELEKVPTADVVPVRHGYWIPQFVSKRGLSNFFICSECAESSFTSHKVKMIKYDYCPNCGTKMDGDPYG